MRRPRKLLFIRHFRRPTGGNLKVRDYFRHALDHPDVDVSIWFAPGSRHGDSDVWHDLKPAQVAQSLDPDAHDLICVNGKDWSLLPEDTRDRDIIHFVQHPGYATDPVLRGYLARPARRLFTSDALHAHLAPLCNGPMAVVPIGLDPAFAAGKGGGKSIAVTILAAKQPRFAAALAEKLASLGVETNLLDDRWRSREEHIATVRASEILVALPNVVEGFYLPPLEGMAAGCVVICSDVVHNRGHCIHGETCLQPAFGDVDSHVEAIMRGLGDAQLRTRLIAGGEAMSRRHSIEQERAAFHAMLDTALADQEARSLGH